MKRMLLSRLAVVVIAAAAAAQSASAPSSAVQRGATQDSATQAQSSNQFPAGTIIPAELSKAVDAKKAKAGDKIEAKTPVDLLSHGKIVIPKNTKIIGHVTEAKAHSKQSPDSMVGIAFDRISMKDGREVPIQAAVQAIARPLQSAALSSSAANDSVGMPSASAPIPRREEEAAWAVRVLRNGWHRIRAERRLERIRQCLRVERLHHLALPARESSA